MSTPPPMVTQEETISALLERSGRGFVPIRKSFLQQGTGKVRTPGPLAELCTRSAERALDLYLLIRAAASAEPFDVVLPAAAWTRMLGMSGSPSARSGVSKALRSLEDRRLITRERAGRKSRIVVLDEAGHGDPYTRPTTSTDPYLKLPHVYWEQGWHLKLRVPGKVVLLIGLSLSDGFRLPAERGPTWYGMSGDTIQRGLGELAGHGLIDHETRWNQAPLSETGWIQERRYTLQPPFERQETKLASVTRLRA